MDVRGKRVLVTGGNSGIGEVIAKEFLRHGSEIIVFGLHKPGYKCEFHKVDVSNEDQIIKAISKTKSIDILVNNAGIAIVSLLSKTTTEILDSMMNVNFKGVFWMCKHSMSKLKYGGCIINISSIAGLNSYEDLGIYCASKAAVISLTKTLALELASKKIRANAIAPGIIDTSIWEKMYGKDGRKALAETTAYVPLKRVGKPEEIAHAAIFLAENEYTNGTVIIVDGGELAE